jgi:DNA-binding transcriptional MerR regulator
MNEAYPIREFARLTGVNPVTLRAWERRYGIIKPQRTAKGHRLYNDEHIGRVKNILYWLEQGYPIRQVKLLIKDTPPPQQDHSDNWQQLQQQMISAATNLDSERLDQLWTDGLACYPMAVYYERCLLPVLQHVRSQHEQPLLARSFEHLLRRKLYALVQHQQKNNDGPALLLATNHEDAELELLACAYALGAAAFHVHYFGPKLSPSDIGLALTSLASERLWLHFHPCNIGEGKQWASTLATLSAGIFLSGAVPYVIQDDDHIHRLPESLGKQVQRFITTPGGLS